MRERQTRPLGTRIATFPGFCKAWELRGYRGKTSGPVEIGPTAPVPVATALRLRHDVAEHVLLHLYSASPSAGFGLHVRFSLVLRLSTALRSGSFHSGASPRRPRGSYETAM